MITFYSDTIISRGPDDNRTYSPCQHIVTTGDRGVQNFTGELPMGFRLFPSFNVPIQFSTFDNYAAGKNVVIIGLHGGWNNEKISSIQEWFISDPNRLRAFNDPNCKIVFDYTEEGWGSDEIFYDLWVWINDNHLEDRVLYATSCANIEELYLDWHVSAKRCPTMKCVWYGFFITWLLDYRDATKKIDTYTTGPRFMNLNRRPHPHRILLLTLLQRYNLLDQGAVSMPKHFSEKEVDWKPLDWDIPHKWKTLTDMANGYIDYLQPNFETLYDRLPLIADKNDFSVNYAMELNEEYYAQFPINVITETFFLQESIFASEKIWKPMLVGQIFIVMSTPLFLENLRKLGFKTFSPYINEEYDTIVNHWERAVAIVETLKTLVLMSDSEFQTLLVQCQPIIDHNREMFENKENLIKLITHHTINQIENFWEI